MRLKINPRVIEQLGKELITSDEIAIVELIKNSYDAGAKKTNIHFIDNKFSFYFQNMLIDVDQELKYAVMKDLKDACIIIEDNGHGMGLNELQEGFFTIGTTIKKLQKQNISNNDRAPLGDKGIGRLAAQRLSKRLYIETTNDESNHTYLVSVEWESFIYNEKYSELDIDVSTFPKTAKSYTRLWFTDLNLNLDSLIDLKKAKELMDDGDSTNIGTNIIRDNLQSALGFLMSPFKNLKEEFSINLYYRNFPVPSSSGINLINVAENEYAFKIEEKDGEINITCGLVIKPWYIERIHQTLIGKESSLEIRKSHLFYASLLKQHKDRFNKSLKSIVSQKTLIKELKRMNPNHNLLHENAATMLLDIVPIEAKIYSFKRDPKISASAIESAKENGYLKNINLNTTNLRSFLEYHNGIKLYRGNCRVSTLGDKDNDWLQLQQARTRGQQFFRFELGNTIGYININDPLQSYIKEISSRQDLIQNEHSFILKEVIKLILNKYFYEFSRNAYYITQDILKEEGLVPRRSIDTLKEEIKNNQKVVQDNRDDLKHFDQNLKKINEYFSKAEVDDDVRKAFGSLQDTSVNLKRNIEYTLTSTEKTNRALERVEQERKIIELETYNNYKLMANGLITEVITHELHSILSNLDSEDKTNYHFENIENHLLINDADDIYTEDFKPLKSRFNLINSKMLDMNQFYTFLERTFLYKGTHEDFETQDVFGFLEDLEKRFEKKLKKYKINLDYSKIDLNWKVPRGALIHVFYNLIDNAIFWVNQRQIKSRTDKSYSIDERDSIVIDQVGENMILIKDSGIGVFKRVENILFHPLVSGKDRNGRGMGLYIVKKLLNSFGADIELLPDRNRFGNKYIFSIILRNDLEEGDDSE
ncbi:Signal transduction histidine kinase [Paenibacillus sp. UNC496MF]|uniref:ATP-binding protein n=1 Tax=Paenibacillus sp. UNC496MF TaxID=1502753 RepID=UPI0008EE497C|nr:ATP-binding protein [Paenibacillus sp. UNC496MF]SFI70261.1 Signal transduction histidine kinase [Paenibacillus sp. UNC496MF]